jgi:hypothetical protein
MHGRAGDLDAVVGEGVDLAFRSMPVELIDPVVDEIAQVASADAVVGVVVVRVSRPTRCL